jgi:hypothetical protein
MQLQPITDERELKDGRIYLCCRSSRHGNAIWETLESQKHFLLMGDLKMPMKVFAKIYDLPRHVSEL